MQYPIAKEKLDMLKKILEDVEVVIVDEMSMISSDYFYHLHKRLTELFDSKDDFGGRALLMVGDVLQLPPVNGRPIFSKPKLSRNAILMNMKDKDQNPIARLFHSFGLLCFLTRSRATS